MTCRWNGRGNPRTIPGRHEPECTDEKCPGCQACEMGHCRICNVAHTDGTCPECMAETREALREIARMCGALPAEVEVRGVEGEAMFLLAPVADPEARGYMEASYAAGRISAEALEATHVKGCSDSKCGGCAKELHPEFVCLSWQMVWRDALEHDDAADSELSTAVEYLDRNMTYMSGYAWVPFEDFAHDVKRSLAHLVRVLHDEPYGDQANVGCFDCRSQLERKLTTTGFEDVWTCRGCRRKYTYAEYNFALRAELEARKTQETTA